MSSRSRMNWRQSVHTRVAALSIAVLFSVPMTYADPTLTPFVVTYVSLENAYLGAGRAAGLTIGDRLLAKDGDSLVTALEVVSLSTHSASCKILRPNGGVHTGDSVYVVLRNIDSVAVSHPLRRDSHSQGGLDLRPAVAFIPKKGAFRPTGSISLRHNQWWDQGISARNFAQSTVDLHLRVPRLWGTGLSVVVRSNVRRDYRDAGLRTRSGGKAWTDRIYQLSLVYDAPNSSASFYAGRIMVPRLATIGYFDGVAIEHRLFPSVRAGVFAGMEPRWHYLESRPPLQKFGGYLAITTGSYQAAHFDLVLAAAGEFHSSTVSREAFHITGHMGAGKRWDISHALELDLNQGWRRQNARSTISLSSLYIDGRYRLTKWLTAGLSYDNRKNYWTYETKSIVDSLFDYHARQGIRTRLDLSLPAGITGRVSLGYRSQQGQPDRSTSYSSGIDKRGFITNRGTIGLQLSGFAGSALNGRDLSLRVGQGLGRGSSLDLGVGQYSYQTGTIGSVKINQWVECSARAGIGATAFLIATYRYSTGEDIVGHRLDAGCTYSF